MNSPKFLLSACITFTAFLVQAQIFINTGNPNLDKYKSENPNAVIWQGGKDVPVPNSTPATPAAAKSTVIETNEVRVEPQVKKVEEKVTVVPVIKKDETAATIASSAKMNYPPNASPGKCYARCLVPDQFEMTEEQVIVKPETFRVEKVAAVYELVYDTIVVKAASKKTITTPAKFEIITEDKVITPATEKWVKGKADKNCLSANPADCEVLCLKVVPAVTQKVTRKVETTAAETKEIETPAVIKVVPRKKMITAATENKIEIAATYKSVIKKVITKKGGYQDWREVLCEPQLTDTKIAQIQTALKREGYDAGPIDNQMGGKTKEALIKFQQDKGLPVGNLNIETLKSLGIQ